jgi:hypothetical protein
MVEICVAIGEPGEAHGLMLRLVKLFDRSAISFDGTRNQVRVRSEWESRSVVEVIDAVQSWLAADEIESAEVSIGGRTCTIAGPSLIPAAGR